MAFQTDSPDSSLSIGELARRSGLSAHTIRFYEAAGVLRPAGRAANGHRRYQAGDVRWLEFVLRLKLTGMPLADIRRYAELRVEGEPTLEARFAMLQRHRQDLSTKLEALQECAAALDGKLGQYRQMLTPAKAARKKEKP